MEKKLLRSGMGLHDSTAKLKGKMSRFMRGDIRFMVSHSPFWPALLLVKMFGLCFWLGRFLLFLGFGLCCVVFVFVVCFLCCVDFVFHQSK